MVLFLMFLRISLFHSIYLSPSTVCSEWAIKIPVIFIMGVATTVGAPKRLLPSGALRCLLPCKFTLGTPCERMNALIEAVLVKPCTRFTISHKVAVFLRSYFLKHDGTVTSFIRALKVSALVSLCFLIITICTWNQTP